MADEGGMEASYKAFDRYPARKDVAEKVVHGLKAKGFLLKNLIFI